jgi:hypothetical protein
MCSVLVLDASIESCRNHNCDSVCDFFHHTFLTVSYAVISMLTGGARGPTGKDSLKTRTGFTKFERRGKRRVLV